MSDARLYAQTGDVRAADVNADAVLRRHFGRQCEWEWDPCHDGEDVQLVKRDEFWGVARDVWLCAGCRRGVALED